jgi:hypothetical protein
VIAVRPEFASCWIKENEIIKRIDPGFIPRKYKQPMHIGIEGLGCATRPIWLRKRRLLGEKVGIIEINDPYSFVEVRDNVGLHFAEKLINSWQGENEV